MIYANYICSPVVSICLSICVCVGMCDVGHSFHSCSIVSKRKWATVYETRDKWRPPTKIVMMLLVDDNGDEAEWKI